MECYILKDKKIIPVDLMTWAKWFETDERVIKQTKIGDVKISTIFLGIEHGYEDGKPLLFETMIFGGEHDQYQERFTTWDEAEAGHTVACKLARVEP